MVLDEVRVVVLKQIANGVVITSGVN